MPMPIPMPRAARWRVAVTGVVQGVGFRPFVHRLARRFQLGGWVRNVSGEVEMSVAGTPGALEQFIGALRAEAPPLARIDAVSVTEAMVETVEIERDFRIVTSRGDVRTRQLIAPDVATCPECEREFSDPGDRRVGYPFITCTNCGPRHSIILAMPYDRDRTTMRDFEQCPTCAREYADIGDRRYHSETNSCWTCGPRLQLIADDQRSDSPFLDPMGRAATLLCQGGIVAVRGIGGFHLAVDATRESAVARLRERKRRDGKPLAVMVRSLADAHALAEISDDEAALLASPWRPIVVLQARPASLAPSVADGLGTVGLMLAYSPLHMRLLDLVRRPLVMTSGNPTNLPLAVIIEEARETLAGIADAFLTHDREIAAPIDDSVARLCGGDAVLLRRARGYAPLPVRLPIASPIPLLAVGAHLKNTFTVVDGRDAFVSQHIGDLETLETARHWERTRDAFCRMLDIQPRAAVRDLHPEYLSTALAERGAPDAVMAVQHHHAHVAAVAAEHGVTGRVIGLAFDGTGLGADGNIWGAEFLVADLVSFRRLGHLAYAPLPGGDAAARQGWRAAVGYAYVASETDRGAMLDALRRADPAAMRIAQQQCEHDVNAPAASSMGRLFDAAAAVLGVCLNSRFEGEAAMRLESLATGMPAAPLPIPVSRTREHWTLDPTPLLGELARRALAGHATAVLAAIFHESVAAASAALAARLARAEGLDVVALGGGVFQNVRLLQSLRDRLCASGLRVLMATALPPNDGAISYGQAAIGAARLALEARGL